jgi:hypothetical protein
MRTGQQGVFALFERRGRLLAGHGREIVEELSQWVARLQVIQRV